MVMVFMISRLRRASALAALLVGSALLTVACQKVPLLAPSGSTITLTALATALPVNGSTDIIAQVIEAGGTPPHSGTLITFTTNLGTVQPSEAETDISGRVTVKYVAGSGSGTATITAISGGVSASGTNAIKIAVGAAAVGRHRLSASPDTVSATGGTSTITAGSRHQRQSPAGRAGDILDRQPESTRTTQLTTNKTAKVTATTGVATSGTGTGGTGGDDRAHRHGHCQRERGIDDCRRFAVTGLADGRHPRHVPVDDHAERQRQRDSESGRRLRRRNGAGHAARHAELRDAHA